MSRSKSELNESFSKNECFKKYISALVNVTFYTILIILIVLLEKNVIPGHRQGFFCNDNSIKFPYEKEETVSVKLFLGLNFGISTILYIFGEICLSRQSHGDESQNEDGLKENKLKFQWLTRIFKLIFSLSWCMAATMMITSVIKSTVGSLRPHFMEVCNPDVDCSKYSNDVYLLNYTCQANKNYESQEIIIEARRSFPSGHSSVSAAVMGFNILYIQLRYKDLNFRELFYRNLGFNMCTVYLRLFLQILCIGVACFIAMSRVMDYYHHMIDVTSGFLLGSIIGFWVSQQCMIWLGISDVISYTW